ncbi:osteocrin [Clinocottus analis]|uniref:osteocrin n=1 Tax=Clinocottus analis TaxID=304258 RepID=UPI0035C0A496
MQSCGCLLVSCFLIITMLQCSDAFRVTHTAGRVGRLVTSAPVAPPPGPEEVKEEVKEEEKEEEKKEVKEEVKVEVKVKEEVKEEEKEEKEKEEVLRLDLPVRTENDVMEPKRKRSFSGTNQLDRLSLSAMETKQGGAKQRVVESPRRRVNPPPVDRIGMSRLPNSRG